MTENAVTAPPIPRARPAQVDDDRAIFAERRRARHRTNVLVWLLRVGILVAFVVLWQQSTLRGWIDPMLISTPREVYDAFRTQLTDPTFWVDLRATFSGAMAGLIAGGLAGILCGLVFTRSQVLERAVAPYLTLMNSLPRPALAPIFILWFGLGFLPKALVAASVVFFLLMTTTMAALQSIDHDVKLLSRSMSMNAHQRFFKIELPHAMPSIVGALRLGAVYAVLGAVVSEMVGAYEGLGQRLVITTNNFLVAESFAVLLAMGIMSMAPDYAILGMQKLATRRIR
jgi:NitT/TauT family transport system permease protein